MQLRQIEKEKHLQKDANHAKAGDNLLFKRQDSNESMGQSHSRDRRKNDRVEGGNKQAANRPKGSRNKNWKSGKGKKPRRLGWYRLVGDPKGSWQEADPTHASPAAGRATGPLSADMGKPQAFENKGKAKAQ